MYSLKSLPAGFWQGNPAPMRGLGGQVFRRCVCREKGKKGGERRNEEEGEKEKEKKKNRVEGYA